MPWIVLLFSAVFEAVWATALGQSNGLAKPAETIVFFIALAVSMTGLSWAVKYIPIGTAYAVWVGIGAALTVGYAMATGTESISVGKIIFISGIIAAVIGLKLVPNAPATQSRPDTEETKDRPVVPPCSVPVDHGEQPPSKQRGIA